MTTEAFVPPQFDNRISLLKLEIVCLVVELGSVARAAEHLSVPESVVTAHLRSVEERFRVTLFARSARTLALTEEGQLVYEFAARTLARGRAMVRELESLEDGDRGAAVIGASMSLGSYLLPQVLIDFRRARPAAEITLTIGDPGSALRGVKQGELDFAIVMVDEPPNDPSFVKEVLGEEEFILVTAPNGQPEADEIELGELGDIAMITAPRGSARRLLIDSVVGRLSPVPQTTVLELGHPTAIKRAVVLGAGASIMSRIAAGRELADGRLREVRITDTRLVVPIYAVRRADKHFSKLQSQLLDAIRAMLATREPNGFSGDPDV